MMSAAEEQLVFRQRSSIVVGDAAHEGRQRGRKIGSHTLQGNGGVMARYVSRRGAKVLIVVAAARDVHT